MRKAPGDDTVSQNTRSLHALRREPLALVKAVQLRMIGAEAELALDAADEAAEMRDTDRLACLSPPACLPPLPLPGQCGRTVAAYPVRC